MRTIDFRIDVLKNGVRSGSIPFYESDPPTVDCDASASIPMTLRGSFAVSDVVDYLADELQPVVIINGTEHKVGVYRAATVRETQEYGQVRNDVEAYDRSVVLSWARLETKAYHASGSNYYDVISGYLEAAGITAVSFEPTSDTLGSAREWDIGTSYLTIVNELLDEMGYDHIWFNGEGTAILMPYKAPTELEAQHTYGSGSGMEYRLLSPSHSRETDIYSRPNVFIVIRTSPDYSSALTATAVNESPLSPLSTVRRGVRIPEVYRVDNIASQTALQAYANKLRDRGMEAAETVQISTAIQPNHGVNDVVALENDELRGVYRESGWSITMAAGNYMTHRLERTVLV